MVILKTPQNDNNWAEDIFKSVVVNLLHLIQISPNMFPTVELRKLKHQLVQRATWDPIDDKPSPEPMLTKFVTAYVRGQVSMI